MEGNEKIIIIEVTQNINVEKKHGIVKGARLELTGICGRIEVKGKAGDPVILCPGEYRVLFVDPKCFSCF